MAQSGENIWTSRFQLLVGLILAGQIIVAIIVYAVLGHSYTRAGLAMTAFLLLCGIGILSLLQAPTPRKIVLGVSFFILIALFALMASSGLGGTLEIDMWCEQGWTVALSVRMLWP